MPEIIKALAVFPTLGTIICSTLRLVDMAKIAMQLRDRACNSGDAGIAVPTSIATLHPAIGDMDLSAQGQSAGPNAPGYQHLGPQRDLGVRRLGDCYTGVQPTPGFSEIIHS